jgi:S1-C subfamily serine protease
MSFPFVVKIHATYQHPDYDSPWQSHSPTTSTGSGMILSNGLILTAAHVVADSTFIQVQKASNARRKTAHVCGVCHDADLALLRVEDPSFVRDVPTLELGGLPALREKVLVCGYPIGGNEISMTEGVVSRVEVQRYSHSERYLLAITVDAAINPGNSGGPVILGNKIIGVAFQAIEDAENIGEVIPASIVRHFLKAHEMGISTAIPSLGVSTQKLENPALRAHLGLSEKMTGVLVCEVVYQSSAWEQLREGDVLLAIDGIPIDNDGSVILEAQHRASFAGLLHHYTIGSSLPLTIWRERKKKQITLSLTAPKELVPRHQYDALPRYYIFGGLVFQPLSRDFLDTWEIWYEKAPKDLLYHCFYGLPTPERSEVVVLTHLLADEINAGYDDLRNAIVTHINNTPITDMLHLIRLIEEADEVVEFTTSQKTRILLHKATAVASQQRILRRYRIHQDRSLDLQSPPPTTPAHPTKPTKPRALSIKNQKTKKGVPHA